MKGTIPETYEIIEDRFSKDLNSAVMLLRHKKTKARVALISNDDDNKVFYIGFRTPVNDSTGVPHIIEHSVLCGSDKFPIHDPFVELAKGSLNTFLNAMTFPDKTVYPVASCNDKDFQNLMHVYLDAVFHPNIYKHREIFEQEGWRYELDSPEGELKINGVVYSEMKGVFSSAEDEMERQMMNSLFPDVTYGKESGGDPDVIPSLTYEQFLEFHQKYYHPTNSYIYLYGDMDMGEKLDFIDREYLSNYDCQPVNSVIELQKSFDQTIEKTIQLPVTDEEGEEDGTFLTYNVVMGESTDRELYTAIKILDYAICSAPGAPIKKALIEKGIGSDVYSTYENGIRQQYFCIVARDTNPDCKEEFISTIKEELEKIVREGFPKKALRAAISRMEFQYREADFGSYPKGLVYGLQMLDSWLYDDTKPFLHVEADETFRILKEKVETGYYEELVSKYLLNNPHSTIVVGVPKAGLSLKKEEALKQKLADYKNSLSEEEIAKIVRDGERLKTYQETPDSKEDLDTIPLLSREDLRKTILPLTYRIGEADGSKILYHDLFTSGIAYITVLFDCKKLPYKLYPYFALLKNCLGLMDTANYTYGDLCHEMDLYTGALFSELPLYTPLGTDDCRLMYEMKTKVLYENVEKSFDLMNEILFTTKIEDEKRLHELIKEFRSKAEAGVVSAGHSVAIGRMTSYHTMKGVLNEMIGGIGYLRFLQGLDDHFEEKKEELLRSMKEAAYYVLRPENMMLDLTSPKEENLGVEELFVKMKEKAFKVDVKEVKNEEIIPEKKNEGFITPGDVQYVAKGGHVDLSKNPFSGAIYVLKTILAYDYLWTQVRVKGGAYGCMSAFTRNGTGGFVSYRDPNLKETLDVYDRLPEYVRTFNADEDIMTKYIIGTLSDLDAPLSPSATGARSMRAYLLGLTEEMLQKERDELLNATKEDINALASYMEELLSGNNYCVVGSEGEIKRSEDVFLHTENLI
ncbi:MAG: insulinase family protein [Lachnospiraceae bacterium]|nr:insulinase family protein [Lachnospiraceae bacterium]